MMPPYGHLPGNSVLSELFQENRMEARTIENIKMNEQMNR